MRRWGERERGGKAKDKGLLLQVMAMGNKALERGEERDEKGNDSGEGRGGELKERTTWGVPQEPWRLGNRGMERHSNAGKDRKAVSFVCVQRIANRVQV